MIYKSPEFRVCIKVVMYENNKIRLVMPRVIENRSYVDNPGSLHPTVGCSLADPASILGCHYRGLQTEQMGSVVDHTRAACCADWC